MATISTEGVITVHGNGIGGLAAARRAGLPRNARDKWRVLERAESKRNAAYSENYDRQQLLQQKQRDLRSKVDHAEHEMAAGWVTYGKADLAEVAEWRAEILELQVEVDALVEERKRLPGGVSISTIREWLIHEPPGRIYRPCIPVVTARKGQTPLAALTETRTEIVVFEEQSGIADEASLPFAEAKASAFAEIDRIAELAKPNFAGALRVDKGRSGNWHRGSIGWPVKYLNGEDAEILDGFALAVWANADAIKAHALAELQEQARPDALSIEDRKVRLAELAANILALERNEEALVLMCEREGVSVTRQFNANPQAILQIQVDDSPAAKRPKVAEPEPVTHRRTRRSGRGPTITIG